MNRSIVGLKQKGASAPFLLKKFCLFSSCVSMFRMKVDDFLETQTQR